MVTRLPNQIQTPTSRAICTSNAGRNRAPHSQTEPVCLLGRPSPWPRWLAHEPGVSPAPSATSSGCERGPGVLLPHWFVGLGARETLRGAQSGSKDTTRTLSQADCPWDPWTDSASPKPRRGANPRATQIARDLWADLSGASGPEGCLFTHGDLGRLTCTLAHPGAQSAKPTAWAGHPHLRQLEPSRGSHTQSRVGDL